MSEESKRPENAGAEEDVRTQGDEGARSAQATPKIGEDAEKGKTTHPAPGNDAQKSDEEQ
jgi:hypothetical protein